MNEITKCTRCGEPLPPGETMFNFHGYSGPCPKPPIASKLVQQEQAGWQLVPVEPTKEMLEAGLKRKALVKWKEGISPFRARTENLRPTLEVAALQWEAMLAAAPKQGEKP